ncbi:hypothetical protein KKE26_12740, partial [bacterium]|nr:hypothetical protein [bacterium]
GISLRQYRQSLYTILDCCTVNCSPRIAGIDPVILGEQRRIDVFLFIALVSKDIFVETQNFASLQDILARQLSFVILFGMFSKNSINNVA